MFRHTYCTARLQTLDAAAHVDIATILLTVGIAEAVKYRLE